MLLNGELGAGKTALTQGLARGLKVPADEPVCSPSYTLMNHHRGRLELYHFDLYRLASEDELFELGFDEYLYGDGVTVIEWADRIENLTPCGLYLRLEYDGEEGRTATVTAKGDRYEELLRRLERGWPDRSEAAV